MNTSGGVNPRLPARLDKELGPRDSDLLGHQQLARQLESYIEDHPGPYSVGLLGSWGSGKSTIKSFYEARTFNKPNVEVLTFNAWRYGGEDLKRALLSHAYLALDGKPEKLNQLLHDVTQYQEQMRSGRLKRWLTVTYQNVLWFLGLFVLLRMVLYGLHALLGVDLQDSAANSAVISVVGAAVVSFAIGLREAVFNSTTVLRINQPMSTTEEYEELLCKRLEAFAKKHKSHSGSDPARLVVFVDDLDRLSAEEMIRGVEAVRAFLELPKEKTGGLDIVFVLSCDEEKLAEALDSRAKQNGGADLPATLAQTDARRYLDRIFQFRLEIPPPPAQDMRDFALSILEQSGDVARRIERTGSKLDAVVSRLIHVGVTNPRNAIQLTNAFLQAYDLAIAREDLAGKRKRGGLREKSVTNYPSQLAALTALKVDFPEFYMALVGEPKLIEWFLRLFVKREQVQHLPEHVRELLQGFGSLKSAASDDANAPGAISGQVFERSRRLQRVIASYRSLSWPPLAPLIQLAMDPLSQEFGADELAIRRDLVSGNTDGVLAYLGRSGDQHPLSEEQAAYISAVVAKIGDETDDRQDAAATVVIETLGRLEEGAESIINFAAHRLSESRELREQVGLAACVDVGRRTGRVAQDDLAVTLAEDLFTSNKELGGLVPNGDWTTAGTVPPDFAHAAGFVVDSLRYSGFTDSRTRRALLNWLDAPHVEVEGESYSVPFEIIDRLIGQGGPELVSLAGLSYVRLICDEVLKDSPQIGEAARVTERTRDILEEHHSALVNDPGLRTSDLLRGNDPDLRQLARDFFKKHADLASSDVLRACLKSAATRVEAHATEEASAQFLAEFAEKNPTEVEHTVDNVARALASLGMVEDEGARYVAVLASLILNRAPGGLDEVVRSWADGIPSDLGSHAREWLAGNFVALPDQQRQMVSTAITTCAQPANAASINGEALASFFQAIDSDALANPSMKRATDAVLAQLGNPQTVQQNPAFCEAVFPAAAHILCGADEATASRVLNAVFTNPVPPAPQLESRISVMRGLWEPRFKFDVQRLAQALNQRIDQDKGGDSTPELLAALTELAEKYPSTNVGIVAQNAALQVWPFLKAAASKALTARSTNLTPTQVAKLAENMDFSSQQELDVLREVWRSQLEVPDPEPKAIAAEILHLKQQSSGGKDDPALRLWLSIQHEPEVGFIKEVLEGHLEDDQEGARLVAVAADHVASSPAEAVLSLIKSILDRQLGEASYRALLETHRSSFGKPFTSRSEKRDLTQVLLDSIGGAPSVWSRNTLLTWIRALGQRKHVFNYANSEDASPEVRDLLTEEFNF